MARILIVDGQTHSREALAALLEPGGHELTEAHDGEQGLHQAQTGRPHLIMAGNTLPGMDSAEFMARLRAAPGLANIPTIFYTAASSEPEVKVAARACGVQWVLCQATNQQAVLSTVNQTLSGEQDADQKVPQALPPHASAARLNDPNPLQDCLNKAKSSIDMMTHLLGDGRCQEPAHQKLEEVGECLANSLTNLQTISLRLTALIDLGIDMASERDPEELLHMTCRVAHQLCGCSHAAIGITGDDSTALRYYVVRGNDDGQSRNLPAPDMNDALLAALLKQREPIRLADLGKRIPLPGLPRNHGGTMPFLGIAIASASRIYGWLALIGKPAAGGFSECDERIASTIASQLAVAWENLALYKEIAQQHDQLERETAERQTAIEDLRRFRLAMDTTEDAIMLVDPVNISFVDFNATTCRMFGYDADELRTIGPIALGAGTREQLRNLYGRVIQGDSQHASAEIQLQRKDGSPVLVEVHRRAVQSGSGWLIVAVARDLTERQAERQRMLQMAHYDSLTGLPNRMLFMQSLKRALEQARPNDAIVVLLLNLDRFQKTNDTLGHAGGDELLRQVAERLRKSLDSADIVGRLGADVFGIILPIANRKQQELAVLDRIRATLDPRFSIGGSHITVTASIGIAVYPDDTDDADALLKYADTAMHWAKDAGRNVWRYFTAEMNRHALERLALENAMRTALEQNQFSLLFQPKANIATGLISGAEVLLRWDRPGFGVVSPEVFMALLEDTGLIVPVGNWVIDETCRLLGQWRKVGLAPIQLSFNVSARQFFDARLEQIILTAVQRHGVDTRLLMLELTESSLMADVEQAALVLENLKRLGLQVALDDFGTGYSSLAYLRRFPIDTLKIDIAFIRELSTNSEDAAIVSAIINMAHSLKLTVVAEGVDEVHQLQFLREHRCDEMQGYWFSPPLPEESFRELIDGQVALKYA